MASRKEEKEKLKAERLERERQAQTAQRRKTLVGYGVGGVLVVAAVAAIVVALVAGGGGGEDSAGAVSGDFPDGSVPPVEIGELEEAAAAADCELMEVPIESRDHVPESPSEPVEPIEYDNSNPPTSGPHYPIPTENGAYTEAPPTEQLVHSLEHGRIVVQWDGVADTVVGDLKAMFDENPYQLILTPNDTNMPFAVAATAWGQLLGCREMNAQVFDALRAFQEEYINQGPEYLP